MEKKIRVWLDGGVISVPRSLFHNARECEIMELDLRFRGTNRKINTAIHDVFVGRGDNITIATIESVKRRVRNRIRTWLLRQRLDNRNQDVEMRLTEMISGNDEGTVRLREAILASIGTRPMQNKKSRGVFDTRVMIIGDLHGSFHPALPSIIKSVNPQHLIVAGDVFDANAVSSARNNPKVRPDYRMWHREGTYIEQEIRTVRALFEALIFDGAVGDIWLMYGNHDANLIDYMHRVIDPAFWSLIRDPFQMLTIGMEDRVHVFDQYTSLHTTEYVQGNAGVKWQSPYFVNLSQQFNLHTAVYISHMNFTGAFPGQAMQKLWKWLNDKGWMDALNLQQFGSNIVLVQAHTHKLSQIMLPGGRGWGIESGTMAHPRMFEYSVQYKNSFSPPQYGYAAFDYTNQTKGAELLWDTIRVTAPFVDGNYPFNVIEYDEGLGNPFHVILD